jgi:hypothetical protein
MTKAAEALDILRTRGYGLGTPDIHTGRIRVWMQGGEEPVEVEIGTELQDLAEGKLEIAEIRARRDDETMIWPD